LISPEVVAVLEDVLVVLLGRDGERLLAILLRELQLLELHVGEAEILVALPDAAGVTVVERYLQASRMMAIPGGAASEQQAVTEVLLDVVDRIGGSQTSSLAERQGESVLSHRVIQVAHVHVDVGDQVVAGRLPGVVVDGLAGPKRALGIEEAPSRGVLAFSGRSRDWRRRRRSSARPGSSAGSPGGPARPPGSAQGELRGAEVADRLEEELLVWSCSAMLRADSKLSAAWRNSPWRTRSVPSAVSSE